MIVAYRTFVWSRFYLLIAFAFPVIWLLLNWLFNLLPPAFYRENYILHTTLLSITILGTSLSAVAAFFTYCQEQEDEQSICEWGDGMDEEVEAIAQ